MKTVASTTWPRPASRELSPDVLRPGYEPDDDDLLPRVPYKTAPPLPNSRKRIFEDEGIGNSSDTPLFSSDDYPASAENYLEYHHKRQRKGPWWGGQFETQEPIIRKKSKRDFRRNFDSGVWMGSDPDIEDGIEDLIVDDQPESGTLSALERTLMEDPENFNGPVFPYWDAQPASEKAFWRVQKAAVKQVDKCVDRGEETVDLSDFGLSKLQEATLRPLQYLVPHRKVPPLDPKWQRFEPFIPNLQLYLANNSLFQVPGQLFKLHDLTVLSLRNNNLEEIPSAIGDLVNLRELNVSYNKLRWLPYEIQQLLQKNLKTWRFHPNPFVKPVPNRTTRVQPSLTPYSTRPAFFRTDGTLARDSLPSPTTAPTYSLARDGPILKDQHYFDHPHKPPSLFETSLRACYKMPELSQLPYLIPKDAPNTLVPSLQRTWRLKQEGGQRCTICKSTYIIPRTEWIEWRQVVAGAAPESTVNEYSLATMMDGVLMCSVDLNTGLAYSMLPFIRRGSQSTTNVGDAALPSPRENVTNRSNLEPVSMRR
ncbi:MAG: hypothetical protein Q9209_007524 [Squamulea sp. 1 TL-2023]